MAKEILLIEIKENGARVVKRSINDIGGAADKTSSSVSKLTKLLAGVVSAKLIKDTVMLADAYANLLNRVRVVTGSQFELKKAMEGVAKISRETRTDLAANVDMYARVALNTKTMGFAMKDVLRFAKQLNHAVILSGVTAREAQWGMVQFSQALAAGALRGDELRAVMEQLPVVTDVITSHLKIGRGELRKLAFEGRVTSKVVIDAFAAAEKDLAERFGKRIPTIDQGLTVLRSNFLRFIGEQDQAWEGTSKFAQSLLFAADNMELLGRMGQVAATIIGGILLTNILKMAAGWQLFNLSVIKTHAVMVLFVAAAATLVVFADKIKIAKDETTTLSDVVRGMGPEFKVVGDHAQDMWNAIADSSGMDNLKILTDTTVADMLMSVARVGDNFAGVFQGIFSVLKNSLANIKQFIRLMLSSIGSFFSALGEKTKREFTVIRLTIMNTARAVKEALVGNVDSARAFLKVAGDAANIEVPSIGDLYLKNVKAEAEKFKGFGKSSAEAFMDGFEGAGTNTQDMMERAIKRGRELNRESMAGGLTPANNIRGLTPGQQTLFKQMTGDVGKLNAVARDLDAIMAKGVTNALSDANAELERGALTTAEHATKTAGLKRELMQYISTTSELESLKKDGIITNEEFAASQAQVAANAKAINEQFAIGTVTQEMYNRKMVEMKAKSLEASTGVADGFKRGFLEVGLEITNFADTAEKTVTNAFNNMEDALVSFVTTGKVDFKGLVDSILADLTRLVARQMISKALGGLMSMGGGGGGMLATLFSSAGTGRANGGPVSAGGAYMVGERGPEPFFPNQSGQIMSNEKMRAAPAAAPAELPPIKIISIWSTEDIGDYMNGPDGERIIVNKSPGRGQERQQ